MQPTVHILVSTYNGRSFVAEQLDSLLAQDYAEIRIHVRDDGSSDGTQDLVAKYAGRDGRLSLQRGDNVGVIASFLSLLAAAPAEADAFYAFCDQDDVWNPDKVSRAVSRLTASGDPAACLYFSRLRYVDAHLHSIGVSPAPRRLGFGNAAVENVVTGCTAVIGSGLRRLMLEASPDDMILHDWWAYLLASALGTLVFDDTATMKYRQHGANVSQWEGRLLVRVRQRAALFAERFRTGTPGFASLRQAEAFLRTYGDRVPADERALVEELVALRERGQMTRRLRYAVSPRIGRNRTAEDLAMRLMIALGQH